MNVLIKQKLLIMIKPELKKDGNGNIIISQDSFELLLGCLDNQKYIGELPQNGDSVSVGEDDYYKTQREIQDVIDYYNRECRKILHQKYIFYTESDGYYLVKKYEYQNEITPWSGNDVGLVYELFKDTRIIYKQRTDLLPLGGTEMIKNNTNPIGKTEDGWLACEPKPTPWLIERPLRFDYDYLTISEDGTNNRSWKKEEIEMIIEKFNG